MTEKQTIELVATGCKNTIRPPLSNGTRVRCIAVDMNSIIGLCYIDGPIPASAIRVNLGHLRDAVNLACALSPEETEYDEECVYLTHSKKSMGGTKMPFLCIQGTRTAIAIAPMEAMENCGDDEE